MFVYCFQYIIIYLHGIALAEVSHPLLFKCLLVVFDHLTAHVGVIFGLLQFLAIDSVDGIVLVDFNGLVKCCTEDLMIDQTAVASLEESLFHTDANDGVRIEILAQDIGPLTKRQSFDTTLHGLDISLVLHMVGDTLETGLRKSIVLLMGTEPIVEGSLILRSLLPHLTVPKESVRRVIYSSSVI